MPVVRTGLELKTDTTLDVQLAPGNRLSGRLDPPHSGRLITAISEDQRFFTTLSDDQGGYELFLPDGTYDLCVCFALFNFGSPRGPVASPVYELRTRHVERNVTVRGDTRHDITAARHNLRTLSGRVNRSDLPPGTRFFPALVFGSQSDGSGTSATRRGPL